MSLFYGLFMKNCHYVSSKENNISMLARLFNHVQSPESSYHNNTYFVKSKLRKINLHNINDHEFLMLFITWSSILIRFLYKITVWRKWKWNFLSNEEWIFLQNAFIMYWMNISLSFTLLEYFKNVLLLGILFRACSKE